MKKLFFISLSVTACGALSCAIVAARFEEKIVANTLVGTVPVGGLTKLEAAKKLRAWWDIERKRILKLTVEKPIQATVKGTADQFGVGFDEAATLSAIPVDTLTTTISKSVGGAAEPAKKNAISFKRVASKTDWINDQLVDKSNAKGSARVRWDSGNILRENEGESFAVDSELLYSEVISALLNEGGSAELPIKQIAKRISDDDLNKIVEPQSEFTTKFPLSKITRNININTAVGKVDGTVLMPGDKFSFNKVVGQRTIKNGFKLAGVYKNGKHDVGIGGGICQVSSTLYNAALLAGLKVRERHNHSLPVPYVPPGRDATVDYGSFDLVIENSLDHPVSFSGSMGKGNLTFRVLGAKDPSTSYKVVSEVLKSWSNGVKYVNDPSLPLGKEKVVEKGAQGYLATTSRVVLRDGVEVSREKLGTSRYKGGVKIIAKNLAGIPASADGSSPPPTATSDGSGGV